MGRVGIAVCLSTPAPQSGVQALGGEGGGGGGGGEGGAGGGGAGEVEKEKTQKVAKKKILF